MPQKPWMVQMKRNTNISQPSENMFNFTHKKINAS